MAPMCTDVTDSWRDDAASALPQQTMFVFAGEGAAIHVAHRFADFIASAESVLRGDEVVQGPLGHIADTKHRQKLAVSLMQYDVAHYVKYGWFNRWRLGVDESRFLVDDIDSLSGQSCPCGMPVGACEDDPGEGSEDMGDFDYFEHLEEADDVESTVQSKAVIDTASHHGVPTFWHVYLHSRRVTPERRMWRQQAAQAFPAAVYLAAYYAHRPKCASRTASAWAVLEAIDAGEALAPALARFLRIAPAAVRAGRNAPVPSMTHPALHGRYRRVFRVLQVARGMLRIDVDALSDQDFQRLGILDALSRASGYRLEDFLRVCTKPPVSFAGWSGSSIAQSRHLLRCAIRRLRAARCAGVSLSATSVLKLLQMSVARALLCFHSEDVTLPCGWQVHPIATVEDLHREGRDMEHCIAGFADELTVEAIQVFSLRSPDGMERVTMKVDLPYVIDADLALPSEWQAEFDAYGLELAGKRNSSISPFAVRAVGEFLIHLDRPDLRVWFSA